MMTVWAVLGGFVLDALFGDPAWLPHPVVYMGKAISRLEKFLRPRLPKTPQGELLGGAIVAFCLPVGTFLLTGLVCWGAARLHPLLGLAVQMFWCGQALAARGLVQESTNVYKVTGGYGISFGSVYKRMSSASVGVHVYKPRRNVSARKIVTFVGRLTFFVKSVYKTFIYI